MTAINESALPKNAWFLYVADYTSSITQLLADLSNASVVKWELDALTYERLASITDLEVIENLAESMLKVDTDDNGTIYKATTPKISVTGNWFELFETNVIEKILWQSVVNQAWTPVVDATQTWLLNTVTKNQFYAINGQNHDWTKQTISSVKQGVTTLVEGTDYEIVKVGGSRWIVFLTAFDATKTTILTYTYTPATSKFQGSLIAPKEIPALVAKVTSVDSATGKNRITYICNCGLESDLVSSFIDVIRAGDMKPTPFEFVGNKQGFILKYFEV